ncbi:hypothetical protein [Streptomyces sp. NPDC058297]|uniref:hypothetical protein n=1 Tax=Streptomyces sp. NPDC058297 TaxID=3346433 RepID=UPI0036EB6ED6
MPHTSGDERRTPSTRRLRVITYTALGAVLVGGGGVAYAWSHLNGNLQGADINAALGKNRPDAGHDGSMNILLLGSDSRAGTHG